MASNRRIERTQCELEWLERKSGGAPLIRKIVRQKVDVALRISSSGRRDGLHVSPENQPLDDVAICARIETLTVGMMRFWKEANGWAPDDAASLLNKSMLEWQASLSACLSWWLQSSTDGELILAWANLGSLVEGQLKLFLSVWLDDYRCDAEAIKKKGELQNPDGCTLESLRLFFVKRIWTTGANWDSYISRIQERRNAIHAFKAKDIGTFGQWRGELREHLSFVRDINGRLPYPDDVYVPREF